MHLIECNLIKPDLLVDLLHLAFPVSDHFVLRLELVKFFSVVLALHLLLVFPIKGLLCADSFVLRRLKIFLLPFT